MRSRRVASVVALLVVLSGCTQGPAMPPGLSMGQYVVTKVGEVGDNQTWVPDDPLGSLSFGLRVWLSPAADYAGTVTVMFAANCGGSNAPFKYQNGFFWPVSGSVFTDLIGCLDRWSPNRQLLGTMLESPIRVDRVSPTEMTLSGSGLVLHFDPTQPYTPSVPPPG